jgi:hypothetical protein
LCVDVTPPTTSPISRSVNPPPSDTLTDEIAAPEDKAPRLNETTCSLSDRAANLATHAAEFFARNPHVDARAVVRTVHGALVNADIFLTFFFKKIVLVLLDIDLEPTAYTAAIVEAMGGGPKLMAMVTRPLEGCISKEGRSKGRELFRAAEMFVAMLGELGLTLELLFLILRGADDYTFSPYMSDSLKHFVWLFDEVRQCYFIFRHIFLMFK